MSYMVAVKRNSRSSLVLIGPVETDQQKAVLVQSSHVLFGLAGLEAIPMFFADQWNEVTAKDVTKVSIESLFEQARGHIEAIRDGIETGGNDVTQVSVQFKTEEGDDYDPSEEERNRAMEMTLDALAERAGILDKLETVYKHLGLLD